MSQINKFQQFFHFIPAGVLIAPPVAEMLNICKYSTVADALLFNLPSKIFGGFPAPLPSTQWFFYNLSIAVGALYAYCGFTGNYDVTKALCYPRGIIGALNLGGAAFGIIPPVYLLFGIIELSSAVMIHYTLPSEEKID